MTALSMMPPNSLQSPSNNNSSTSTTNKRKRDTGDLLEGPRPRKSQNTNADAGNENDEELQLHLLQGLSQEALQEEDDANARSTHAALTAAMQQNTYPPPENSFEHVTGMPHALPAFDESSNSPPTGFNAITPTAQALMAAREANPTNHNKPAVGTQQWHQQRKDNHKEVERRRRETINEGINELAKVIPGTDKNKGAILQSAVGYITELSNKQHSWENERATLDIAIKELAARNDKMRESMEQAWAEAAKWQKRCRDARLPYDDYDEGALQDPAHDDNDGVDV